MALFFRRRLRSDPPGAPAPDFSGPTDLARFWEIEPSAQAEAEEPLWLGALTDRVYVLMEREDLDDDAAETLSLGYPLISGRGITDMPGATFVAARSVAAVGYMARHAEYERFPRAQRPTEDGASPLRVALGSVTKPGGNVHANLAAAAADLARREAIDPGQGDEFRPSWTIPGISVEERRMVRERTLTIAVRPQPDGSLETPEGVVQDATLDDIRRTWKYGFFLRCLVQLTLKRPPGTAT